LALSWFIRPAVIEKPDQQFSGMRSADRSAIAQRGRLPGASIRWQIARVARQCHGLASASVIDDGVGGGIGHLRRSPRWARRFLKTPANACGTKLGNRVWETADISMVMANLTLTAQIL
jgi:hypothetical protein